jgi:hypothetical protein
VNKKHVRGKRLFFGDTGIFVADLFLSFWFISREMNKLELWDQNKHIINQSIDYLVLSECTKNINFNVAKSDSEFFLSEILETLRPVKLMPFKRNFQLVNNEKGRLIMKKTR